MKLVERKSVLTIGGSCANCGDDYRAFGGFRMLMKYKEDDSYIIEPFNLCRECAVTATSEGGL